MSSSHKSIGVGIIGVQGYGSTYFDTLKKQADVKVVAICDIHTEAASKLAEKHHVPVVVSDYKQLINMPEINAVFIATPHFLHYTMAMEALKQGKHVFCEKPLAIKTSDAWEMAKTARALGLILSCHYNRRQSLHVKLLRDLVEKDVLGTVYQANVKWMARWTEFMFNADSSWRISKEKAGGGILIGRGSHMMDAIWYILGKPEIQSVYATTTSKLTGFEVDDYAMVVMKMKSGTTVHLEFSYEANLPAFENKIEYELLGTKAGAVCSQTDGNELVKIGCNQFPKNEWVDLSDQYDVQAYTEVLPKSIVEDFIGAVRDGRDTLITAEDAAFITQLLESVYKSSDSGDVIKF